MAAKPEQEPSIEEILASIRQIISDDDQPRSADVDLTQGPEEKFVIPVAEPEPEKPAPVSSFADVLELTNEIPAEEKVFKHEEEKFTIPVAEPVVAAPPPPPPPPPAPPKAPPVAAPSFAGTESMVDSIFSNTAAEATASAFSKLLGNMPVEREENTAMYAGGRVTLEDIARDLLRPMLSDWVNNNVPRLVERLVEKELEKLTKQFK